MNVRIITATNRDIENLVAEGSFREDLYYRINVVDLHLPPLRERKGDIPLLITHFIKKYSEKYSKRNVRVSDDAMEILKNYDYSGNIRELENIIERALVLQEDDNIIRPEHIKSKIKNQRKKSKLSKLFEYPWKEAKQMFEKRYIENKLGEAEWNVSETARISGIDRSDLHKKIEKYGIKK